MADSEIIDIDAVETGSTNRFGQLVVQTFAGDMVIGAEGLAEELPRVVGEVLTGVESLDSPDEVSGALLNRLASDPRFAQSLQVGTAPSAGSVHTVWLRHHHHDTWWMAEGSDPDRLQWLTWGVSA